MTDPRLAELSDEELARRPFDELVVALQQTVQALEAGNVGLEESIELYRHGLRLHAACEERLRRAELQITELGRRGVEGAPAAEAPATDEHR
ncbi:MAG TPA: exodeoxyribonuclease VII small subunit [candidate division Zixibacteria bacterium]|nr:exodeoxyribonuclease VII small subunit [candidate division Zixibacteria bacterium]